MEGHAIERKGAASSYPGISGTVTSMFLYLPAPVLKIPYNILENPFPWVMTLDNQASAQAYQCQIAFNENQVPPVTVALRLPTTIGTQRINLLNPRNLCNFLICLWADDIENASCTIPYMMHPCSHKRHIIATFGP